MNIAIELAERRLVPNPLIRRGIRGLLRRRLRQESARHQDRDVALAAFTRAMADAPLALSTDAANDQHYEVPAEFFRHTLGPHLKYSSAYFPRGDETLAEAEAAMLALTAERAELEDGQRILELGCGWGSLTLWMARNYRQAQIVAVSNSHSQREHILSVAKREGLDNIEVITRDINAFDIERRFDRVVSVEMFEHLRNWQRALHNVRRWLADDGRVFLHFFAHRRFAYPFETSADDDWMGRHFFTGGMMPAADLLERIDHPFVVDAKWEVSGTHYQKTAEAWADNLERKRDELAEIFARQLGRAEARRMVQRWSIFFGACAELFGYDDGREWFVCHYRLAPRNGGQR